MKFPAETRSKNYSTQILVNVTAKVRSHHKLAVMRVWKLVTYQVDDLDVCPLGLVQLQVLLECGKGVACNLFTVS